MRQTGAGHVMQIRVSNWLSVSDLRSTPEMHARSRSSYHVFHHYLDHPVPKS